MTVPSDADRITAVVAEYVAARDAYEEATRPRGFEITRSLRRGHPIMARWVLARQALSKLVPGELPAAPEVQMLAADDSILWGAVANAGRLSTTRQQRWAHVMDATGQGSASAYALCLRFKFDPDEVVGIEEREACHDAL